ncbi:MAG: diguanylate cyclase [Elusimicrobiales bacterium]|nr:diguanylate cyclase [Elusimicrobiales bacterium]
MNRTPLVADDSVDLRARADSADKGARCMLGANPLTLLPGEPAIEEEAWRRIKNGEQLAYFHIDIDNFKAYNDAYGHLRGDAVIRETAKQLLQAQREFEAQDVFLGHIGGDDFVLISSLGREEQIASAVARRFDQEARGFYGPQDLARGFILSTDRQGGIREFPLMTLSIAIAANDRRELAHYAGLADIAAEIKNYLKRLPGRTGSLYLKDRRKD